MSCFIKMTFFEKTNPHHNSLSEPTTPNSHSSLWRRRILLSTFCFCLSACPCGAEGSNILLNSVWVYFGIAGSRFGEGALTRSIQPNNQPLPVCRASRHQPSSSRESIRGRHIRVSNLQEEALSVLLSGCAAARTLYEPIHGGRHYVG